MPPQKDKPSNTDNAQWLEIDQDALDALENGDDKKHDPTAIEVDYTNKSLNPFVDCNLKPFHILIFAIGIGIAIGAVVLYSSSSIGNVSMDVQSGDDTVWKFDNTDTVAETETQTVVDTVAETETKTETVVETVAETEPETVAEIIPRVNQREKCETGAVNYMWEELLGSGEPEFYGRCLGMCGPHTRGGSPDPKKGGDQTHSGGCGPGSQHCCQRKVVKTLLGENSCLCWEAKNDAPAPTEPPSKGGYGTVAGGGSGVSGMSSGFGWSNLTPAVEETP
mmetsp:Transcript_43162/g.50498  ORF Transcript_43162/g.50498 Transcript_43162/m.50498 type:complete len:279 (+) Transcript_43162:44-880(+)|eukprot:CAMPEP_0194422614 /NCGR_PEP_ID=MMETSP0176-20130528/21915_1 /TAXON_ID=216777 /ORGANISM="Proboscia alata, Strain PI-D3" /LENGTH=278 /DNA_ID=CAMNT_0039231437 /DNA_START=44 /DNA_END=880 /DNA_ORIENTATION=-